MNNLDKYLKIAKKIVIKPSEQDIEDKIINRLTRVDESDRSLLDENFMDYLKKSNSRLYLFSESVKNNPGKYALLGIFALTVIGFLVLLIRRLNYEGSQDQESKDLKNIAAKLPSSKN
jgi:hypothetical protein